MAQGRCTGLCVMPHFKINYDISKGLPPTIKNRLDKKKCNSCGIWMRIDEWWCFCCGQKLSKRRKKSSALINQWHNNYPTFKDLKMLPSYIEKEINRINQ
jgi:hypothetical protein